MLLRVILRISILSCVVCGYQSFSNVPNHFLVEGQIIPEAGIVEGAGLSPRIVGGAKATPKQFPYQVSLRTVLAPR